MVTAENGALPGGKAGGVGDVLRDLPPAVAETGRPVTILMPSYGRLHETAGMEWCGELTVPFAGIPRKIQWYGKQTAADVDTVVLHHDLFDPHGNQQIYHDDGPDNPFATDATKFALLCAAAGRWLVEHMAENGVLHLHDWHAGLLCLLGARDPAYAALRDRRTVLTLHNLALQGLRPRRDHESSFTQWFPHLDADDELLSDPRYPDVANPLAAAIRQCDQINTVSPTNAVEIVQPNDPSRGFHGGEGLEHLLQQAASEHRLHGILNGCDYSRPASRVELSELIQLVKETVAIWRTDFPHHQALYELALRNLTRAEANTPNIIVTAVSRLTNQKAGLLLAESDGSTLLQKILRSLPNDCLVLILGSGDPNIEAALAQHAASDTRLVFLRGFSEKLASAVFGAGDLFLMPSTYEPCGISQMYAMRAGQPCLVHAVGGLNDTVTHRVTGFSFRGSSTHEQIDQCMAACIEAQQVFFDHPAQWSEIVAAASALRFPWQAAAQQYSELMYE
ncbi:MAG: glycogen/starch synthase [Pseudomonadota bacterium]